MSVCMFACMYGHVCLCVNICVYGRITQTHAFTHISTFIYSYTRSRTYTYKDCMDVLTPFTILQLHWFTKKLRQAQKYPFLPNLIVLNSNLKSVFTHHLYFFLDMHSVHFVHIRYIKAYMNSGLILIL